jgi:beta-exotoxin I transport system ATP-binding protein
MMDAIAIDRLTKRYGTRIGVSELSLRVAAGSVYGFLGPNGAGKTTTIRVLMGFLKPSEGRANALGQDCWAASDTIKRDVGYLPGDLRLYSWMTARTALDLFGSVRGMDLVASGLMLAEEFGLDVDVLVRSMSRGMRQKLGIVLALAHKPKLLILDEPTASLDPIMQEKLHDHIRQLAAAGHTIFLSSHTLSEVERLCDRVSILREGRLVAEDSIAALRKRAARRVTIRWRNAGDAANAPAPPLELDRRTDAEWSGTLSGTMPELIAWAAPVRDMIEDLSIGEPDLTEVFHGFYR